MNTDLVRIHHAKYLDDIPFWISLTEEKNPILEVGCGHGRVTLPLLAAGHEITGVDIDPQAVQYLRDSLARTGPPDLRRAEIIQEDIINYRTQRTFGAALVPCNTYSTFQGEKRTTLVSRIYHLLQPGGIFGASLPNPSGVLAFHSELLDIKEPLGPDLETTIIHPVTGFPVQVSSNLIAREDSLVWEWIYDHLYPDGQVERLTRSAVHYLSSLDTYLEELSAIGYSRIETMGDFDGREYADDSPYLILVGRK